MADPYQTMQPGLTSPAFAAIAVTPNDGADLANVSRGLWVGQGGDVAVILATDTASVIIANVSGGSLLPIRVKRVLATGTTATALVALL
jgi:hypothetical protein